MEEIVETTVEDQVARINEEIEEAIKAKDEKLAVLRAMVDQRFDHMLEMWSGAVGYELAAEKWRIFYGTQNSINFEQLQIARNRVNCQLAKIYAAYKEDAKEESTDWSVWLDKWCNESDGVYRNKTDIVVELLILDMCQHVWEALRRIPEFEESVEKEIEKMREELAEISEKEETE